MQRPDLATLACVSAECQYYGRQGQGNLTIRKVYGQDGIRLLRCRSCHEEFSERRHTALFNTKVSEAKAEAIIDHLDEGCSIRATSRLTKATKVTVARLLKTSGRHAQRFHAQEIHDLRPRAIQFDEQWSFVKKKQKNCSPEDTPQAGDFWDHTAIAPDRNIAPFGRTSSHRRIRGCLRCTPDTQATGASRHIRHGTSPSQRPHPQ